MIEEIWKCGKLKKTSIRVFKQERYLCILGIFEVSGKSVILYIEDAYILIDEWPIYQITKVQYTDKVFESFHLKTLRARTW